MKPAGFGVIARNWEPRLKYAGTYDSEWQEEQFPLLPLDFDNRHFQTAPEDQQLPSYPAGDVCELTNMTKEGIWKFRLPKLIIPVHLRYSDRLESLELSIDTLLLEPDDYRFTVTSRGRVQTVRSSGPLLDVVVGEVTEGWKRAQRSFKAYIDLKGARGSKQKAQYYEI